MKKRVLKNKKIEKKEVSSKKNTLKVKKNLFLESVNFVLSSKKFIFFSAFLFFLFFILGFIILPPEGLLEQFKKIIEEMQLLFLGASFFKMFVIIFLNNLRAGFLSLFSGIFFGIFPLFFILSNGYFGGFVSSRAVVSAGWGSLFNLVPHGILELPAIFICTGLGFKLGLFIFNKNETFLEIFWRSIKAFFFIVIPLLFIAAIVESSLIFFLN